MDLIPFINFDKKYSNKFKKDIYLALTKYNFCIIKNVISEKEIVLSKNKIFNYIAKNKFINSRLLPEKLSFQFKDWLKIKDKQKHKKYVVEGFVPMKNNPFALKKIFTECIKIRNFLYGLNFRKNIKLSYTHLSRNFFTASRLMCYPNPKGYLQNHKDLLGSERTKKFKKYFQIICPLTKKGLDFDSGGAVVFAGTKKIMVEDYMDHGDMLVYNEKILHGVEKIFSLNKKKRGKISALVTFYEKFK